MRNLRFLQMSASARTLVAVVALVAALFVSWPTPAAASGTLTVDTSAWANTYDGDLSLLEALRLGRGDGLAGGAGRTGQCLHSDEKARIALSLPWLGGPGCWLLPPGSIDADQKDTILFVNGLTILVSTEDTRVGANDVVAGFAVLDGDDAPAEIPGLLLDAPIDPENPQVGSFIADLTIQNFPGPGILCNGCQDVGFDNLILRNNSGGGLRAEPNSGNGENPRDLWITRNTVYANSGSGIAIFGNPSFDFATDFGIVLDDNFVGDTGDFIDQGNTGDGIYLENVRGVAVGLAGSTTPNVVNYNNGYGIVVHGFDATNVVIRDAFVGLDRFLETAKPNSLGGIHLREGAYQNTIGPGNILSGNSGPGIDVSGFFTWTNAIVGNRIGTNSAGSAARPNQIAGIRIGGEADETSVGLDLPGMENVISGNNGWGVGIFNTGTTGTVVRANFIGTDLAGTAALPNTAGGVRIQEGATDCLVELNLISGNGAHGVAIRDTGTTGHTVAENRIGTNALGTAALGNALSGVAIWAGAVSNSVTENTIGGNGEMGVYLFGSGADQNLVSNNVVGRAGMGNAQAGIAIHTGSALNMIDGNTVGANGGPGIQISGAGASGNTVIRNRVGFHPGTFAAVPNNIGIHIQNGASNNSIGSVGAIFANTVSGNTSQGIRVSDAASAENTIEWNRIGVRPDSPQALGNSGYGIFIEDGSNAVVRSNIVAANGSVGVQVQGGTGAVVAANFIGTTDGTDSLPNGFHGISVGNGATLTALGHYQQAPNTILSNAGAGIAILSGSVPSTFVFFTNLAGNGGLGIDLFGDGVTPNNLGDLVAPQHLARAQNFPVLTEARLVGSGLRVKGVVRTRPDRALLVAFHLAPSCDPSGHGEGLSKDLEYYSNVSDANGDLVFTTTLLPAPAGQFLVAFAQDVLGPPGVETSELSTCRRIVVEDDPLVFDDGFESGEVDGWSSFQTGG